MGSRTIYFLFTDTGTYLSKIINYYTKRKLNHVSLGFDCDLEQVYSFGRKQPKNPFSGGFVQEDIHSDFLKNATCAVYQYRITESEYQYILNLIEEMKRNQHKYRYNFLGLVGFMFRIQIRRKHAYFCSQFVGKIMHDSQVFSINKPYCFITPDDIRQQQGLELIYEGKLADYQNAIVAEGLLEEEQIDALDQTIVI
ncbi:hypothetical protein ACFFIS_04375 [Virgibacillus soli]|uniref:Uncharacterized protein n=1 Tax=Paracerasibacillus soli TaxID=480284 RepID=A0ABU5CTH5_9BACI|nr:hypothetical protein [Virgibacillus soli]MDY0409550.1 hypothetical protein [Virgibacillus soli]